MTDNTPFWRLDGKEWAILSKLDAQEMPDPQDHLMLQSTDPLWALMRQCWVKESSERPTIDDCAKEVAAGRYVNAQRDLMLTHIDNARCRPQVGSKIEGL